MTEREKQMRNVRVGEEVLGEDDAWREVDNAERDVDTKYVTLHYVDGTEDEGWGGVKVRVK